MRPLLSACLGIVILATITFQIVDSTEWTSFGGESFRSQRWASNERRINKESVKHMKLRWTFNASSDVSATPAISRGVLYVPDWGGYLWAINASSGALIWSTTVAKLLNYPGPQIPLSRSTPVIFGKFLLVGVKGPAVVIAVDKSTGQRLWTRVINTHPLSQITGGGMASRGYFYVGASSREESVANRPKYTCCTFMGSFSKLRITDGAIMWTFLTVPNNHGAANQYSGNAVWGSAAPVDEARGLVYIATGNNYRVPDSVALCQQLRETQGLPSFPDPCTVSNNYLNSVVAINTTTGKRVWSVQMQGYDSTYRNCAFLSALWNQTYASYVCHPPPSPPSQSPPFRSLSPPPRTSYPPPRTSYPPPRTSYPPPRTSYPPPLTMHPPSLAPSPPALRSVGRGGVMHRRLLAVSTCSVTAPPFNCSALPFPDYDFGENPVMLTFNISGVPRDVLTVGQKSGVLYAMDRSTGELVWATSVGPGGNLGGMAWGSATDGQRVYVGLINNMQLPWALLPSQATTLSGGWAAVDAITGKMVWSVANPRFMRPSIGFGVGAPAVANGVVFVTSADPSGYVYALDAVQGSILFQYATGGAVYGGFSISNGCAYIGSGYAKGSSHIMTGNNKLFAFCV